jgi:hypothetical protein
MLTQFDTTCLFNGFGRAFPLKVIIDTSRLQCTVFITSFLYYISSLWGWGHGSSSRAQVQNEFKLSISKRKKSMFVF